MIKILHVVGKMDMAGLETLIMNFYRNIDRNCFQFDFIALSGQVGFYDEEIKRLGGNVFYPLEAFNWKKPGTFKKWFENIIRNGNYQILHSHNGGAAPIILPIAKKYSIATIVHSHNTGEKNDSKIKKYIRKISRIYSFLYVDVFMACSKEAGKYLFGNRNFDIINNAIDTEKFIFNPETRLKIRNQLEIDNEFVVGVVGRLTYQKNPQAILDIMQKLTKQNNNCKLVWIGKGEMEDAIREEIAMRNLEDKILMLGAVDNVNEFLQAMDIFILPSFFEGLGIVAIESQATGLVTLCSDMVPQLAAVTELCRFVPLNDMSVWVELIENEINCPTEREDKSALIKLNGFDIVHETERLSSYYYDLCK